MLSKARGLLKRIHQDDAGAMAVEKVLLLGLIALPIIVVLFLFRQEILEFFSRRRAELDLSN